MKILEMILEKEPAGITAGEKKVYMKIQQQRKGHRHGNKYTPIPD